MNPKRRTTESKLEGTVNYFQFVDCTLDAAKQNEEPKIGHQSRKRKPI